VYYVQLIVRSQFVNPKRSFFLSHRKFLYEPHKNKLSVIATMQQRTNAESIRAESEKVRQANEERLREKRMVRAPLFDSHSRVGVIFFFWAFALIDLDAGHVPQTRSAVSEFFRTFARTFFPTLPFFLSKTMFYRVRKEDSNSN
jgi:hypothetical protein